MVESKQDFVIAKGVLTKYNGPGGDVVIPAGVKKIEKKAFSGCHRRMALIAPYFPISDIEKDDKLKACCGFARAYLENAAPDGEINAGYLRYIKIGRAHV